MAGAIDLGRGHAVSLPSHRPDGAGGEAQAAARDDGAGGGEVGGEGGGITPCTDGSGRVGSAVDGVAGEG